MTRLVGISQGRGPKLTCTLGPGLWAGLDSLFSACGGGRRGGHTFAFWFVLGCPGGHELPIPQVCHCHPPIISHSICCCLVF